MRVLGAVLSGWLLALAFPVSLPDLPLPYYGNIPLTLPGNVEGGGYAQLPLLAFIALIPLFDSIRRSGGKANSFVLGYIAGISWLGAHLVWLISFGVMPVALMVIWFGLPVALFSMAAFLLLDKNRPGLTAWGIPLLWVAFEYLRSFGLWAFPWNLLGYSQAGNLPLVQAADIGGVFLVTFVIVLVNAAIFILLTPQGRLAPRIGHALLAASVVLAVLAYGEARKTFPSKAPGKHEFQLALIQGGLSSLREWDGDFLQEALQAYTPPSQEAIARFTNEHEDELVSRPPGPYMSDDLVVVWPESALPTTLDQHNPERVPPMVRNLVDNADNAALLMGVAGRPNTRQRENGALLLDSDGNTEWAYSKVRLVPYGEVVPFREAVRFLQYPWGKDEIACGRVLEPFSWRTHRLGMMVCFDNVFPFVAREEVLRGAECLVLMTNNSWYKLQSGIRQHCEIDVFRAIENRRPLARVSTTGWSHIITPLGERMRESDVNARGVIYAAVEPRGGKTVYMVVGDLFAQICLVVSVALCGSFALVGKSEGIF